MIRWWCAVLVAVVLVRRGDGSGFEGFDFITDSRARRSLEKRISQAWNNPLRSTPVPVAETSSTPAPSTSFQCQSEGWFPDPKSKNCKRYFICSIDVDGRLYVSDSFRCPFNLIFDPLLRRCNWKRLAPPCKLMSQRVSGKVIKVVEGKSSGELPWFCSGIHHPQPAPTQPYYKPASIPDSILEKVSIERLNGVSRPICSKPGFQPRHNDSIRYLRCIQLYPNTFLAYQFRCAEHFYYNATINACLLPADDYAQADEAVVSFSTPRQSPGSAWETKQCAKTPGKMFRHLKNCRRFYRCVKIGDKYHAQHQSCPIGLVFDNDSQMCTWVSRSKPCAQRSSVSDLPQVKFKMRNGTSSRTGSNVERKLDVVMLRKNVTKATTTTTEANTVDEEENRVTFHEDPHHQHESDHKKNDAERVFMKKSKKKAVEEVGENELIGLESRQISRKVQFSTAFDKAKRRTEKSRQTDPSSLFFSTNSFSPSHHNHLHHHTRSNNHLRPDLRRPRHHPHRPHRIRMPFRRSFRQRQKPLRILPLHLLPLVRSLLHLQIPLPGRNRIRRRILPRKTRRPVPG